MLILHYLKKVQNQTKIELSQGMAQLVARSFREAEAVGSSPITLTILYYFLDLKR